MSSGNLAEVALLLLSILAVSNGSNAPISISLPLPLASVPQPVTINKHPPTGNAQVNNDVIGYIVVPYPGIDQRSDAQPLFSLLGGAGTTGPSWMRNYRRPRIPYPIGPIAPIAPAVNPFLNPLINPLAYGAFPGYPSIYGFTPRIPLINYFG